MKKMQAIPHHDRPREKIARGGAATLSDLELLTAVLGQGHRGGNVWLLARRLLAGFDKLGPHAGVQELAKIQGIGPAKAALLVAAMEFARRRIRPSGVKIREARDILPLIRHYADRRQEHFLATSVNGANEVIATRVVTVGTVNHSLVHAREVFAEPITDRAAMVILAHNHPSGSVRPSKSDFRVTRRMVEAGELLNIPVIDHIIFSHGDYYSFAENNWLAGQGQGPLPVFSG